MKNNMILLTNDDGIKSEGLLSLRNHLKKISKIICVAPSEPSSAISKALTFHKPLRFFPITFEDGDTGYSTTGSPADNVHVGFHILKNKPDIVVSGINYGDNSSIHSILTSGTCAAAFEAAFNDVPAIAFSADVAEDIQLTQTGIDFEKMAQISQKIVDFTLKMDWPKGLAFLNVNYPTEINDKTEIYITKPILYKYDNYMVEKKDPRGVPYLWLWGEKKRTFPEYTDTWSVCDKKGISVSPIGLNINIETDQSLMLVESVKKQIESIL